MLGEQPEGELPQGGEHLRPERPGARFRRLAGGHDLTATKTLIEDGRRHVHDLELGHLFQERVVDDVSGPIAQQRPHPVDSAP